jgi:hypothetical protein
VIPVAQWQADGMQVVDRARNPRHNHVGDKKRTPLGALINAKTPLIAGRTI